MGDLGGAKRRRELHGASRMVTVIEHRRHEAERDAAKQAEQRLRQIEARLVRLESDLDAAFDEIERLRDRREA